MVTLPDVWAERFLARVETWEADDSTTKQGQIERLKIQLSAVKAKIERLNTAFADGSFELAEFKEMKNPLVPVKVELESQMIALESGKARRLEPLRKLDFGRHAKGRTNGCPRRRVRNEVISNEWVGSNRLLRAQTLTVSFLKPWDSLAETNLAARSAAAGTDLTSKWWTLQDSNL